MEMLIQQNKTGKILLFSLLIASLKFEVDFWSKIYLKFNDTKLDEVLQFLILPLIKLIYTPFVLYVVNKYERN